ncbi:MAG: SH3 domain-containing protein [Thermomicrobiales bacterium]
MSSAIEGLVLNGRLSRRAFAARAFAGAGLLALGLQRAASVGAASFGPGDEVVTTDAVNYRSAPGLNSTVYTVLSEGYAAVVQDSGTDKDGYTWYLIRIATGGPTPTGYVAGDFLELSGGGGGEFAPGDGVMTTSAVNYRDAPGLNSNVYVVLPEGSYAVVQDNGTYKDGYTWYLVRTATGGPSPTGYIAADFLTLGSPSGGNFDIGDWVYVNSGPLNFRSSPSLSGSIIRTLATNDIGQVVDGPEYGSGYTWYEIQIITGDVGWVVQDFLSAGDPPPPSGGVSVGDTIKVVDGPLNIRSGPGSSYGVIDYAATGAIATVTAGPTAANGYTWIKISGNLLADGWVAFEFCEVV